MPVINESIAWRAALLVGVLPGGFLAAKLSLKSEAAVTSGPVEKTMNPKAVGRFFVAGFGMSLGAMVGGGCTTGAFLAAWPTLSIGSFTMAGTFFVVSMAVSNLRMRSLKIFDIDQLQMVGDRVYD